MTREAAYRQVIAACYKLEEVHARRSKAWNTLGRAYNGGPQFALDADLVEKSKTLMKAAQALEDVAETELKAAQRYLSGKDFRL